MPTTKFKAHVTPYPREKTVEKLPDTEILPKTRAKTYRVVAEQRPESESLPDTKIKVTKTVGGSSPPCAFCLEKPRTVTYLCCKSLLACVNCHSKCTSTICIRCGLDWKYVGGFVSARYF